MEIGRDVLAGNVVSTRAFARLVGPADDIAAMVSRLKPADIPRTALLKGSLALKFDPARVLAALEEKNPKIALTRDEEVLVASHDNSPLHLHIEKTDIHGVNHLGVYIEGSYCPDHSSSKSEHDHEHSHDAPHNAHSSTCGPDCCNERFTRILNVSVAVAKAK